MSEFEYQKRRIQRRWFSNSNTVFQRIDLIGILLLIGSVIGLLFGFGYHWDSPQVLGGWLVAGELLIAFFIVEQFVPRPLIRINAGSERDTSEQAQAKRKGIADWSYLALLGILLLSAFLHFCQISNNGLGNIYYASTVKSMMMSWHNFFFVAYEPGGFIAMDKPPVSLWLQTASAELFGLNGFSLVLPLALAGIVSVAVLYHLVQRTFGIPAGLLAALFLALMPVSVVASRATTMDGLLSLDVLLAGWAVIKAAETGSVRWLLVSAMILGIGFNIKMMEAYLILPTYILLYALAAPRRRRVRALHLVLAIAVILIVSFSWSAIVDSFPASQRPYVGSSGNDTEIGLGLGYNGVERPLEAILGLAVSGVSHASTGANVIGELYALSGGPTRLLTTLGDQVSWLLPLAIIGLFASLWHKREEPLEGQKRDRRLSRQQQAFIFWSVWFIMQAIFFTLDVLVQSYYLVMLAPSVAAMASIGLVGLWHDYRKPGWRGWLLPLAFILEALLQASLIAPFPAYNSWLTPLVLVALVLVALVLIWLRIRGMRSAPSASEEHMDQRSRASSISLSRIVTVIGAIAVLLGPALWSIATTEHAANGLVPVAGPVRSGDSDPFILLLQGVVNYAQVDPRLVSYLEQHQGDYHYLVATSASLAAAPFILQSGRSVMPIGGFNGNDYIFTVSQLEQQIKDGNVRYFWLSSFFLSSAQINQLAPRLQTVMRETQQLQSSNPNYLLLNWVHNHCTLVTPDQWGAAPDQSSNEGPDLYDCANFRP